MIITLYPNSSGSTQQHTPVGAAANWDCIDEDPHDSDGSYNESVSGLDGLPTLRIDMVSVENPVSGLIGAITNVRVELIAKYDTASVQNKIAVGLRSAGSNDFKSDNNLTGTYDTYTGDWATNPITGVAWTWAEIAALQIGYRTTVQDDTIALAANRITRARALVTANRAFKPEQAAKAEAYAMAPEFVGQELPQHIGLVYDLRARVPVKRGLTPQ